MSEINTSDKIEYLQEHDLWVNPDGDMDPIELTEFCDALIDTQEVDIEDMVEWVSLKYAQEVEVDVIEEKPRPAKSKEQNQTEVEFDFNKALVDVASTFKSYFNKVNENTFSEPSYVELYSKTRPHEIVSKIKDIVGSYLEDNQRDYVLNIRLNVNAGPVTISSIIKVLMDDLGSNGDIDIRNSGEGELKTMVSSIISEDSNVSSKDLSTIDLFLEITLD